MPLQKTNPEEIIQKSILVFRQKGYYRTSMSDLAKATGLTKGALYHYFSNKEEVMRQALLRSTQWFEHKAFSLAYAPDLTAAEKLDQMLPIAFRAFTDQAGGCFFANTILETAHVEETFLGEIKTFFSLWEAALKEIYQHSCPPEDLPALVQEIIADIEGAIILMQLYKDKTLLQKALQRSVAKL